jgi:hypothetical protein
MDPTQPLTLDEARIGASAAVECRRIMVRQTARLGGFMAGVGMLFVVAGYLAQGRVAPWAFLFPDALAAIVVPNSLRRVLRLTRLVEEFQAAERTIAAGGVVRGQDIPSLGLPPPA